MPPTKKKTFIVKSFLIYDKVFLPSHILKTRHISAINQQIKIYNITRRQVSTLLNQSINNDPYGDVYKMIFRGFPSKAVINFSLPITESKFPALGRKELSAVGTVRAIAGEDILRPGFPRLYQCHESG